MKLREAISTFRGHRIPNVQFIGRKNLWFAFSGVFILLSLVGLLVSGLNFSIAFTGGSLLQFENKSGVSVADYQAIMAKYGRQDAQVTIIGGGTVQIRTESLTELDASARPSPTPSVSATPSVAPTPSASATTSIGPVPAPTISATPTPTASPSVTATPTPTPTASASASPTPTASASGSPTATPSATASPPVRIPTFKADLLRAELARKAGIGVEEINEQDIGPTWGNTISHKMYVGLVVFVLLVTLYITFRFEWKMAIGALAAMGHDLIITAGVYALVGREVTPETVIAILTILGYSLYDTVVIFDKVKENSESAAMVARDTYSGVVNLSLNQTLMRSVNTSLVVLLPIGSLLLFGGQTLKDFAFALFVGVASGTYSSVFVAAPILSIFKEREPRFQQIRARAEARSARPGLRAVPATRTQSISGEEVEAAGAPAGGVARGGTSTAHRARVGTATKKKKGRPQGKPKRRRR